MCHTRRVASTAPDSVARTRQKLLEAAADEFLAHGFGGARIKDIAIRAGLTTGAIYGQFRNKEDLILAAIFDEPSTALENAIEQAKPGDTLLDTLRAVVAVIGQPDTERERSDLLILEAVVAARQSEAFADALRTMLDEQRVALTELLHVAAADGTIRPDIDIDDWVSIAFALAMGRAFFHVGVLRPPSPESWSEIVRGVIDVLEPDA